MRARSWIGTFSIRSTSPESSAATRGPALVIGRKIDALPGRLVAPIGVVALQHDAVALGVAHEPVGPGADRGLAGIERLGLGIGADVLAFLAVERHRAGAVLLGGQDARWSKARWQQRIRLVGRDHHGERIGRRHAGDRAHVDAERRRRVLHPRRAAERIDHVVGGEVVAVGELHARPQLELPGRVVEGAPRHGEARLHQLVLVLVGQPVEDVLEQRVVGREIVEVRVHRRGLGREPDLEFLRAGLPALLRVRATDPRDGGENGRHWGPSGHCVSPHRCGSIARHDGNPTHDRDPGSPGRLRHHQPQLESGADRVDRGLSRPARHRARAHPRPHRDQDECVGDDRTAGDAGLYPLGPHRRGPGRRAVLVERSVPADPARRQALSAAAPPT